MDEGPHLVLIHPWDPLSGKQYPLVKVETLVGRDRDCEIQIDFESVSRRHARVYWTGEAWFVQDLQSTNGTFVNDVLVARSVLHDVDFLKLGNVIFQFHSGPGPSPASGGPGGGGGGDSAASQVGIRLPS